MTLQEMTEILLERARRLLLGILALIGGVLGFSAASFAAGAAEARRGPEVTHAVADAVDDEAEAALRQARAFNLRARASEARHDPEAGQAPAPAMVAVVGDEPEPVETATHGYR